MLAPLANLAPSTCCYHAHAYTLLPPPAPTTTTLAHTHMHTNPSPTHPTGPPQVDLIPNGHAVPVTNDNVVAYIHRVADFKLNQQIREPTAAFLRWVVGPVTKHNNVTTVNVFAVSTAWSASNLTNRSGSPRPPFSGGWVWLVGWACRWDE